jgi:hypothetical protein
LRQCRKLPARPAKPSDTNTVGGLRPSDTSRKTADERKDINMTKKANTTPEQGTEAPAQTEENTVAEAATEAAAEPETAENTKEKMLANIEAVRDRMAAGTMKLTQPIRAGGKDVAELEYDFRKLTGWEYVDALDTDRGAKNLMTLSAKQAMALFATAAGKATKGIDARDIMERMGAEDAATAISAASVFFKMSASLGNKRISNA